MSSEPKGIPGSCCVGDVSYSLNSLKGVYMRDYVGELYRGYSGGY